MSILDYEVQIPYGVVRLEDGLIQSIVEKPLFTQFVNAGIYVLEPDAIALVRSGGVQDMPEIFNILIRNGHRTAGFPVRGYWRDVGRISDLDDANRDSVPKP